MTTQDTRKFEMLVRVGAFGEVHRELFPKTTLGGQAFDEVGAAVVQLGEHAVSRLTTAKGGRKAKALARAALVEQLETVARIARGIAASRVGFDDAFQLPRLRSDRAYLTTGRTFVKEAERVKDEFVRYDMPEEFVAVLARLVDEFEQTTRAQHAGREEQTRARAGFEAAMAKGLAAVQVLDTVVPNRLHNDPVTLKVWEQDRRVDYSSRRRRVTTTAPVAPVADVLPTATATTPEGPSTSLERAS